MRANSADICPKQIHLACIAKETWLFSFHDFAITLQLLKNFFHERLVMRKTGGTNHQIYLHVGGCKRLLNFRRKFIRGLLGI